MALWSCYWLGDTIWLGGTASSSALTGFDLLEEKTYEKKKKEYRYNFPLNH
jgi:hypothetical protein